MSETETPFSPDVDGAGLGTFRVLETFDRAATDVYQPLQDDIRRKVRRALDDFPELNAETVTVGRLDPDDDVDGRARFTNRLVLFPTNRTTTFMTVYHELGHLAIAVRDERGEDVPPTSEEFCSIFSVARMPIQLIDEDSIPYLGEPSAPKAEWPRICRRALRYREEHRNYIQKCEEWLNS